MEILRFFVIIFLAVFKESYNHAQPLPTVVSKMSLFERKKLRKPRILPIYFKVQRRAQWGLKKRLDLNILASCDATLHVDYGA